MEKGIIYRGVIGSITLSIAWMDILDIAIRCASGVAGVIIAMVALVRFIEYKRLNNVKKQTVTYLQLNADLEQRNKDLVKLNKKLS